MARRGMMTDHDLMNGDLYNTLAAAAFWILLHVGVSGSPLRRVLAARLGEHGFRMLFSALSLVGIVWLAMAYGSASGPESFYGLWLVERWMLWVPTMVMPAALILFVGALTTRNPTAVGAEAALRGENPARGILRITRHPMLWAFALWAAAHLIANGDLASLIFFGSIIVVSLAGMPSIDRKRARSDPDGWRRYAAATSVLPFLAIAQGRNRLPLTEIGLWRLALAILAWGLLIALHRTIIGVPAVPA